jgi:hypothetical protein
MANNINSNEKERERIIFLQGFSADDSKELSKEYPQIIIFSSGKNYSALEGAEKINFDRKSESYLNDPIIGTHIYKNGIEYSLVRGIHPEKNSITINETTISIKLDENGLIQFGTFPIEERYFYVGKDNPLNNENNILISKGNNIYEPTNKVEKYNSINNLFVDKNHRYYKDYIIPDIENNEGPTYAYLIVPASWENNIWLSNTLDLRSIINNNSYIGLSEYYNEPTYNYTTGFTFDNIGINNNNSNDGLELILGGIELNDSCKYNVYKTTFTCSNIRIYYSGSSNRSLGSYRTNVIYGE